MVKLKSRLSFYLAGTLLFLAAGILLISWSEHRRLADYQALAKWKRLRLVDQEGDPEKALALARQFDPGNPRVGIRIMRRRWQLALDLYRQQTLSEKPDQGENPAAGTGSAPARDKRLEQQLFALEKTGQRLRRARPAPGPENAWRIENLLGAGYLMRALLVLDRGGETRACQALLHQAIACFKKAISLVDRLPEKNGFGNIPRWNLELLITSDRLAQAALADSSPESRYDLRRNLTILLPGSSGYLSGEPPDNRVLK